jgi:hypothetical protein
MPLPGMSGITHPERSALPDWKLFALNHASTMVFRADLFAGWFPLPRKPVFLSQKTIRTPLNIASQTNAEVFAVSGRSDVRRLVSVGARFFSALRRTVGLQCFCHLTSTTNGLSSIRSTAVKKYLDAAIHLKREFNG